MANGNNDRNGDYGKCDHSYVNDNDDEADDENDNDDGTHCRDLQME